MVARYRIWLIIEVVYSCEILDTNVVFLIGSSTTPNLINSVKRHYCEDSCQRWKRLGFNIMHLIPDLFCLFTDWNSTLFALKAALRDAEARSMSQSLPVTVHTRLLHHKISNVIELRESLQFHQAVIQHTLDSQEKRHMSLTLNRSLMRDSLDSFESLLQSTDQIRLKSQLQRMKEHMTHNAITLDTIKDQFLKLVQLVG
jgi:hypothetical protein